MVGVCSGAPRGQPIFPEGVRKSELDPLYYGERHDRSACCDWWTLRALPIYLPCRFFAFHLFFASRNFTLIMTNRIPGRLQPQGSTPKLEAQKRTPRNPRQLWTSSKLTFILRVAVDWLLSGGPVFPRGAKPNSTAGKL